MMNSLSLVGAGFSHSSGLRPPPLRQGGKAPPLHMVIKIREIHSYIKGLGFSVEGLVSSPFEFVSFVKFVV